MAHWLLKTEPGTYSWDDLVRDGRTAWDGVRNFLARNNLQAMKAGDTGFLYHSVGPRDVVGVVEIVREAYPDQSSDDPRWMCVDIVPKEPLPRPVSLDEIKVHPTLADMVFVRMSRLSVSPVSEQQWQEIRRLATQPSVVTTSSAPKKAAKKKAAKKKAAKKKAAKKKAAKKKAAKKKVPPKKKPAAKKDPTRKPAKKAGAKQRSTTTASKKKATKARASR